MIALARDVFQNLSLRKLRYVCGVAASLALSAFSTPSFANVGYCGSHSVDDLLMSIAAANAVVELRDGKMMGRGIADVFGTGTLERVDDTLVLYVDYEGADTIGFTLERLPPTEYESPAWTDFGTRLDDMGIVTGCDDPEAFPRYSGTGYWRSSDGIVVPATIEFFLWLSPIYPHEHPAFTGMGIMRSEWLSGKIFMTNYLSASTPTE
ncbi:hypothetical protein [Yoonia sp. I 8.24]|uniref:hypothetical protein n=1 Tax=Yoonia sp. I 8.24 TaxID=1537229 RepID=UPI001EE146B6|nr:hypothetical protein [Yoonia sp. I 8.24]MCG3268795.1 hypothetical protein [Yoonia sp. I 8.24]